MASGQPYPSDQAETHASCTDQDAGGAVFVMTNDADGNEVLVYRRDGDGQLHLTGSYPTGGRGNGRPHLSSQGSMVLSSNRHLLVVANPGSDDISVFRVRGAELKLIATTPSDGSGLARVAVEGNVVYALHKGGGDGDTAGADVNGFHLTLDGRLSPVAKTRRLLSAANSNPAQVGISPDGATLVVTEEATSMIGTWPLDADGKPGPGAFTDSARKTPFGFAFTRSGMLVVANAEEGGSGRASLSSYRLGDNGVSAISGAVLDLRSEVCWTVLSQDERFAYVTNFGDGTVSSYTLGTDGSLALLESVAGVTTPDQPSVRDASLTADGRFLYAIDVASLVVHGWALGADGALVTVGTCAGLPATAAGLAAL